MADSTDMPAPLPAEPRPSLEKARRAGPVDKLALTTLYEEHRAEIFAFLVRMTRDREIAEDLVQDTFVKLVREARAGRMPDNVRGWLYRVAANAATSRGRRASSFLRLVPRLVDRDEPERPDSRYLRSEREIELHVALAGLKPDARAALLMASQGFSGHEIAASIGRTEGATRTLICRSRVQLRLHLEATEGPR